jgi:hypothetical protein
LSEDHFEDQARFEKFKDDFFKALSKLSKMQKISEILDQDDSKSKLSQSI